MSLQKIFDFESIHSLRHSVLDTESVNVGYFIIGVYATPTPAPNILSFLLRRKKKVHWIRKKYNADSIQSLNSTQNS